jgi:hypothetical protein
MEAIDQIEGDDSYLDYLDILLGPADSLTNRYFSSINFLHFLLFYFNFVFYVIDFSLSSLEPIGACILCKKKKKEKGICGSYSYYVNKSHRDFGSAKKLIISFEFCS